MMARPRGNDWLDDEMSRLVKFGVKAVVSLLEKEEELELGLSDEKVLCNKHGIDFIHFPIKDRSVPKDEVIFRQLVNELKRSLEKGAKIVIHCRMGIGRTSLLTASLLILLGHEKEGIFKQISEVRTLKVPDTLEQEQWVRSSIK